MIGGRLGKVKMEIRDWNEKSLEGESGKVYTNKEASQKQSHRLWLEGFSYCHGGRVVFAGKDPGEAALGTGPVTTERPRQTALRVGRRVALRTRFARRMERALRT